MIRDLSRIVLTPMGVTLILAVLLLARPLLAWRQRRKAVAARPLASPQRIKLPLNWNRQLR